MGDRIGLNQYIQPGQSFESQNGQYQFIFQTDRNLVLYKREGDDNIALWASDTYSEDGADGYSVLLQQDGNFVMYDGNGTAIWATQSNYEAQEPFIAIQDDGNVCMYDDGQGGRDGNCFWATNTWQG